MTEHPNAEAIGEILAEVHSVHRPVVRTERINGDTVKDGYTSSYMDQDRGVGFTAIAFGTGHLKIYVEMVGTIAKAEEFGKRISAALENPSA